MNEKVENLVLEQLREIRGGMVRMFDEMRGLKAEMTAVRHHVRGIETLQDQHHTDLASVKSRLERIEKRLDLVDERPGAV